MASVRHQTPSEIFRRVSSIQNLRAIFAERVSGASARGRDGVTASAVRKNLDEVARRISERLRLGTYKFTTYSQKLILKGAGKRPREISIPTIRDRIALRALVELLTEVYPDCIGKLPQTCVADVKGQIATGRYDTFVRIDVKEFYPSINHDFLIEELGIRIKKKEILRVVRRAIATPTAPDRTPRPRALSRLGVPQGLPVSNPLAEIYMRQVDAAMSAVPAVSYHRFVDDIVILCSESDAEEVDEICRTALAKIRLSAHPKTPGGKSEIGLIAGEFTYLSYRFGSSNVSVSRSSIARLESRLASIYTRWRRVRDRAKDPKQVDGWLVWRRNLTITGCVFEGVAIGWIQYFRQLDDLVLLKRLDASVKRLEIRYGAPAGIRPKTFMRTYWTVNHPRPRSITYVPNFDQYDVNDMKTELEAMGMLRPGSDIKEQFYRIVTEAVRELEHDVGDLS